MKAEGAADQHRARDAKLIVAKAYNQIAEGFLERLRDEPSERTRVYLERLTGGFPAGARILDLGCGAGVPYTRWLAARYRVVGVDISRRQLALARRSVPGASFVLADMSSVQFRAASFDAIAALYSIIHVPREEQQALLTKVRELLKPGGRLLAVLGANDWEGSEDDWLGLGSTMLWSHFDAETSLDLVTKAGLRTVHCGIEPDTLDDSGGAHLFVIAEP